MANPIGVSLSRNPITGIADCCARAVSGHATAAPPSSVMNSRLFTAGAFRASKRKDSTPAVWQQQTAAVRDFDPGNVRFGSWLCQNCSTRRRRRNILKELHIRESKILHTTMFDALMENSFFYISRMYEFLHRLGHKQTLRHHSTMSALSPEANIREHEDLVG